MATPSPKTHDVSSDSDTEEEIYEIGNPVSVKYMWANRRSLSTAELWTSNKKVGRSSSLVTDSMTYDITLIGSWGIVWVNHRMSVWRRRSLWMMVGKLSMVSGFTVLFVLACASRGWNPSFMQGDSFRSVTSCLQMCSGFLLGFFLTASVNRWWSVYEDITALIHSLELLHNRLVCFGVPPDKQVEVLRLGYLSAEILYSQLTHTTAASDERDQELSFSRSVGEETLSMHLEFTTLRNEEVACLAQVDDAATALWIWLCAYLHGLSEEGWVPHQGSAAFAALMRSSQEAHNAIRAIRATICCQAPFIYTQMLACLVHINNIISAISFGFSLSVMAGHKIHRWGKNDNLLTNEEVSAQLQDVLVGFVFCALGAVIYQALFEVAVGVSQPMSDVGAMMPMRRMLEMLEIELKDGIEAAKRFPGQKPRFKKDDP